MMEIRAPFNRCKLLSISDLPWALYDEIWMAPGSHSSVVVRMRRHLTVSLPFTLIHCAPDKNTSLPPIEFGPHYYVKFFSQTAMCALAPALRTLPLCRPRPDRDPGWKVYPEIFWPFLSEHVYYENYSATCDFALSSKLAMV